jgi:hypothetical protein
MLDQSPTTLTQAYEFAAENEGLAFALDHLLGGGAALQDHRFRAALVCLATVLSDRCRQLTVMIEQAEKTEGQ